jgi:enoyl-CoA hydratase/carnithine racemase
MSDDTLRTSREGRVLTLTLNDPATRNSLSTQMYVGGRAEILNAAGDDDVGAIIITGAEGNFCSGGNITRLRESIEASPADRRIGVDALHGWIKAIRDCPKPIIAAVEGAAAGAGCSLALACDLIVSADTARFVVAYVKIGLNPDGGSTAFFNRGLPPQLVAELCFFGDPIGAERLHQLGVVNKLTAPGSALDEATAWATRLANGPSAAISRAKALISAARHNSFEAQLDMEADLITQARDHPEAAEGLNAFLEKRKPDFQTANKRKK